ncbi:MAG TPA: Mrp/NBP35 family ATP-binding protein [Candidatus Acidoferrales bacterium]|nr:Mrp/NBP35 family ATP-binding protein [Candidatus Acidoferrales bacterium]
MAHIDDIRERLSEIKPLGSPQDIVSAGLVRAVDTIEGSIRIRLAAPGMPQQTLNVLVADIRRAVGALDGVRQVNVELEAPTRPSPYGELGPLPGVRDIVAVSSTKGGVGKSTIAANLALALSRLGKRVGLLDSDIYGPSVPIMFGINTKPEMTPDKRIVPIEKYGLKLMSIGFFLDESSPVIWRGPMVMGAVRQFLKDVAWEDLDVLLVDMPPGTGDAQLTLVQQVPLAGGVVVTTPQDIATLDVERGIAMFQQVNTPVLGIIENMSDYVCPHCGTHDDIFGSGGAERIAAHFALPVLAKIPLVPEVRHGGDSGKPLFLEQPDHPVSRLFSAAAESLLAAIETGREAASPPTIIG